MSRLSVIYLGIKLVNTKIVEIHKLHHKRNWCEKFSRSYDGNCRPFSEKLLIDNARFFVAKRGTRELGFIRINDKGAYFDCCVWNISEAFVKPVYRSQGVLREMIQHVILHCNVKMLHISAAHYFDNLSYYESLGFEGYRPSEQPGIGWVFLRDFDVDAHRKTPRSGNESQTDDVHLAA